MKKRLNQLKNCQVVGMSKYIFLFLVLTSCENKIYDGTFDGENGVLKVDSDLEIKEVYLSKSGPDTICFFRPKNRTNQVLLYENFYSEDTTIIESDSVMNFSLKVKCKPISGNTNIEYNGYYDTKDLTSIKDELVSEGYR